MAEAVEESGRRVFKLAYAGLSPVDRMYPTY